MNFLTLIYKSKGAVMKVSIEFGVYPNFGMEAPDHKREFVFPPVMVSFTPGFSWALDSNGIVWVSEDNTLLSSPCLHHCLGLIKYNQPYVDMNMLQDKILELQKKL